MAPSNHNSAPGNQTGEQENATVALGSNLGEREAHLLAAVEALAQLPRTRWLQSSPVYETEPVGGPTDQGPYLNAVVRVETRLPAPELLRELFAIERSRGRVRETGVRDAPRTLDLDLLLYGAHEIDVPDLRVPHPRLATRRFVLVPLCDLAADERHPGRRESYGSLLAGLAPSGDVRRVAPPPVPKNTARD